MPENTLSYLKIMLNIFAGIDRIVLHENFTSGVTRGIITNDIALIRLKQPIEFNNFVQPVCLPESATKENDILWATGWGETKCMTF